MRTTLVTALAVSLSASVVHAQHVVLRIVERTGQTQADTADNVLDFAVQAQFTGFALSRFSFDIQIPGEAESRGTLTRGGISNADGTYDPTFSVGTTVGRAGVARQYSYLGTVNASFNGVINQSSGTFTNTPNQEIGLVAGAAAGAPALGTPGIDADSDGNPDTWSGNGTGTTPADGATAALAPVPAATYFASTTSQYTDIYRFRYVVTDLSARTLHLQLNNVLIEQSSQWKFSSGLWGADSFPTPAGNIAASILNIGVVPAPAAGGVLGLLGLSLSRRRRVR